MTEIKGKIVIVCHFLDQQQLQAQNISGLIRPLSKPVILTPITTSGLNEMYQPV